MKFTRRVAFEEFVKRLPAIFADLAKRSGVVLVEKEGKVYRLEPIGAEAGEATDPWASYEPKKIKAALKKYAGFITKKEAKKMIADLYAARRAGSRPVDRP